MTIGDPSVVSGRFSKEFSDVYDSCKTRSDQWDLWKSPIGEREDMIRKALYLGAHWSLLVGSYTTGKHDNLLEQFRQHLYYQTRAEYEAMIRNIHLHFMEAYRRHEITLESLDFAHEFFHNTANPVKEVVRVILTSRSPSFEN